MKIVIEIDGDKIAVHTDRQLAEANTASIVDAGSAPAELLRQFGGIVEEERSGKTQSPRGKRGLIGPGKETFLNPLRAGEAVARQLLGQSAQLESESMETIDAGRAPKLPKISGKEKRLKRPARRK
jgi:hypothetical protein